jgi:tripartite-type tricarboxylate transporter receptor subunit TctC
MKRIFKLLLALVLGCSSFAAPAQTASRPLRILVPFSAGGVSDTYTRIAAVKITEQTGKPIVVENRTGSRWLGRPEPPHVCRQVIRLG